MAAHDEFANKQNNPCFIGLGSVGAAEPSLFDTCLIVQNILNSLDSSPPAPAHSPLAYAAAPALCVTNTSPLSPQVLAALVAQLRTGSKSLLVRTVAVDLGQQCTGKGESVEDMVTRSVEALFAEESLKVRPVGAFAEVLGSVEALLQEIYKEISKSSLLRLSQKCWGRSKSLLPAQTCLLGGLKATSGHKPSYAARCLIPVGCLMMT